MKYILDQLEMDTIRKARYNMVKSEDLIVIASDVDLIKSILGDEPTLYLIIDALNRIERCGRSIRNTTDTSKQALDLVIK